MRELIGIAGVVVAGLIGAVGGLCLKKGSGGQLAKFYTNKSLLLGIILYGMSTVIFVPALRFGSLTLLYPFVSLTYVWIALLSNKILGEKITRLQWMGIMVTLLGVAIAGIG